MLSQAFLEDAPTKQSGKGALGTRRSRLVRVHPDTELGQCSTGVGTRARANLSRAERMRVAA